MLLLLHAHKHYLLLNIKTKQKLNAKHVKFFILVFYAINIYLIKILRKNVHKSNIKYFSE